MCRLQFIHTIHKTNRMQHSFFFGIIFARTISICVVCVTLIYMQCLEIVR